MVEVRRRYRLLVTDVDGTLLPPDRRVLPAVREALRAVQGRGVQVCLATGRMWRSVRPYVEAVGADSPVVLYNGAVVYDFHAGRVLEHHTLDWDGLRVALEVLQEFPDVRPHVFAQEAVYVDRLDPQSRAYLERDGITAEEVGDLLGACLGKAAVGKTDRGGLDTLPRDPVKVLVVGTPHRLANVERELARRAPKVRWVFSEPNFLELLPMGVSKGTALRTVCAALGVRLEEVVAVGDNPNDAEMLQAAGLGVAVANAHPAVRGVAGYVTRARSGEALVEVVERFFLNGSPADPEGR